MRALEAAELALSTSDETAAIEVAERLAEVSSARARVEAARERHRHAQEIAYGRHRRPMMGRPDADPA